MTPIFWNQSVFFPEVLCLCVYHNVRFDTRQQQKQKQQEKKQKKWKPKTHNIQFWQKHSQR